MKTAATNAAEITLCLQYYGYEPWEDLRGLIVECATTLAGLEKADPAMWLSTNYHDVCAAIAEALSDIPKITAPEAIARAFQEVTA